MKEALLIIRNFPPVRHSGTIRVEAFAKHLPKYGFRPTVLSSPTPLELRDSLDSVLSAGQRIELPWRLPKNFLRRQMDKLPMSSSLERQRNRRDLAARSVQACIERGIRPDIVLASCPPGDALVIGQAISQHYRCPLVCDFRDPWSHSPRPCYPHLIDFQFEKHQEQQVVNNCTAITATTRASRHILQQEFGADPDKIHLIPNGYEPEEFQNPTRFEPIAAEPNCFHIVYSGEIAVNPQESLWTRFVKSLGFQYDPLKTNFSSRSAQWFLKGLEQFLSEFPDRAPMIRVWFIGESRLATDSSVTEFPYPDVVRVVPRVPPSVAIGAVQQADLLLLLQIETFLHGVPFSSAIPGKLYSYLASGRRILAAVQPSENSELIDRFQAGTVVSPTSPDEFSHAIRREFDRWQSDHSPPTQPRSIPEFERPQQTALLAELFDTLIAESSKTPVST